MSTKVHESITADRVIKSIERRNSSMDNPGICLKCGADHDSCEPDARRYECYECGERAVFGDEEILIQGLYHG